MSTMQDMSQNYKQFAGSTLGKEDFIVLVYAKWCGHCKVMKPDWYELGHESDMHTVTIEEDVYKHLINSHPENPLSKIIKDTRGYPFITNVSSDLDNGHVEYQGRRDKEALKELFKLDKPAAKVKRPAKATKTSNASNESAIKSPKTSKTSEPKAKTARKKKTA